jgi:hypothetical protein
MGYLADIVRDSRRKVDNTSARGLAAPVGGTEMPPAGPVAPDVIFEGPSADRPVPMSVARIREEGSGRPENAGQHAVESGFATRQVAGPSPSEHIPAAGLPEATAEGLHLPDPVARTQAGCESARTDTDGFRVEETESFHDGDSSDAPAVSGVEHGSSIVESSPGYAAASRAGNVSAETQGRRQAGAEPRAGSTTPPEQPSVETVAQPLGRHVAEMAASPLPVQEPERRAPALRPVVTRDEDDRSAVSPENETSVAEPRRVLPPGTAANCTVTVSPGVPVAEVQIGRTPEPAQSGRQRTGEEKSGPGNDPRSCEPKVQIGTIEVVVVSPPPAAPAPSRGDRSRPDPASRNYVRIF